MQKQINFFLLIIFCQVVSATAQETSIGKTVIDPIGYLKERPSENSQTITVVPAGDTVDLHNWYEQPYVKVSYRETSAYISIACLKFNCDLIKILRENVQGSTLDCSPIYFSHGTSKNNDRRTSTSDCHATSNCGCSNKKKADCDSECCQWIVGKGCSCR